MANKKIIVSSGDGKYQEVPSSSFSVDGDKLIVKNMSVQTASFTGGTSGSIMQISGGILAPIWTTSSILAYSRYENDTALVPEDLSGTLFQYKTGMENYNGIGPHRIGSASFSGDVEGTISSSIRARVVSVANVNSGTLNSQFGGTGTGSFDVGSLVTLSGSGFNPAGNADKVVVTNVSGDWSMQDKSLLNFAPMTGTTVYLFTGSVATSSVGSFKQNNWSPPAGTRFIRVICQGGGGGGGGGHQGATAASTYGGGGGGGGGYCDVTFNALTLNFPINIVAGNGGYGAGAGGLFGPNFQNGYDGGSSSFGNYIYSNGGLKGSSTAGTNAGGSAGVGYITFGANGGKGQNASVGAVGGTITTQYGAPGGGGAGGNLTSGVSRVGYFGGSASGVTVGAVGQANETSQNAGNGTDQYIFNFSSYYLNSTSSLAVGNFPKLLCAGGSGGGGIGTSTTSTTIKSGAGGSAIFGAGGGGSGGRFTSVTAYDMIGQGGSGGKGYVLIICT